MQGVQEGDEERIDEASGNDPINDCSNAHFDACIKPVFNQSITIMIEEASML